MVLITRTSPRRTSLSAAEDCCLHWRYSCHTFDIIFCGLYGCCGQQTVHTNTRLRYKEIPLSLISCLLWQWKKLLYQSDISQEGGKNYESEQRKKKKTVTPQNPPNSWKDGSHTNFTGQADLFFQTIRRPFWSEAFHMIRFFFVYFTAKLSLLRKWYIKVYQWDLQFSKWHGI